MKRIFLNVLLVVFVFLITPTGSFAQVYQYKEKQSRQSGLNLKDSVKSVRFMYTKYKEGLSSLDKSRIRLKNDVRTYFYLEFTKAGNIKAKKMFLKDINQVINRDSIDTYIYNNQAISETKFKTQGSQIMPAYHHEGVRSDIIKFSKLEDENLKNVFNYIIVDNKIREERKYTFFATDTIFNGKPDESYLIYKKLYQYDKDSNLGKVQIISGEKGKRIGSIAIMETQATYCDDTELSYTYDNQNRITKVILYSCKTIVASEEYTYHSSKDYITILKRYIADPILSSYPSRNMIAEYNEYGDITHMHFVVENDTNPPRKKIGLEPVDRYYEYDYDSHNNWIRCRLYLMGDKDEPTVIAERRIEYYNK